MDFIFTFGTFEKIEVNFFIVYFTFVFTFRFSMSTKTFDVLSKIGSLQEDGSYIVEREIYDGKGFVKLLDCMPRIIPEGRTCDFAIVAAARTSYNMGLTTIEKDNSLIDYLFRNRHTSPFEMGEIKFVLKVPIFVARQLIRHRTANLNEQSLRYSEAKDDFLVPEIRIPHEVNKQSSVSISSVNDMVDKMEKGISIVETSQKLIEEHNSNSYSLYEELLKKGVAREIARSVLPVNLFTTIVWKIDLHNFLHFAKLRMDFHAQKEIVELACALYDIVKMLFPVTCKSFEDNMINGVTFNSDEIVVIKKMIDSVCGDDMEKKKIFINSIEEKFKGMKKEEFKKKLEKFVK